MGTHVLPPALVALGRALAACKVKAMELYKDSEWDTGYIRLCMEAAGYTLNQDCWKEMKQFWLLESCYLPPRG